MHLAAALSGPSKRVLRRGLLALEHTSVRSGALQVAQCCQQLALQRLRAALACWSASAEDSAKQDVLRTSEVQTEGAEHRSIGVQSDSQLLDTWPSIEDRWTGEAEQLRGAPGQPRSSTSWQEEFCVAEQSPSVFPLHSHLSKVALRISEVRNGLLELESRVQQVAVTSGQGEEEMPDGASFEKKWWLELTEVVTGNDSSCASNDGLALPIKSSGSSCGSTSSGRSWHNLPPRGVSGPLQALPLASTWSSSVSSASDFDFDGSEHETAEVDGRGCNMQPPCNIWARPHKPLCQPLTSSALSLTSCVSLPKAEIMDVPRIAFSNRSRSTLSRLPPVPKGVAR